MDLRWLDDFMALVTTGNFTRAAELRNSSQPAFSRRIRSLEGALNITLFDRSSYPTRLTPEGETFRHKAVDIMTQLGDAVTQLAHGRASGEVRVALPFALATANGGHWTQLWCKDGLRCRLMPGALHDLFTALVAGHADIAISYYSPYQPVLLEDLQFERIKIGRETVRPYVLRGSEHQVGFPGTLRLPCKVLNYPASVYFGRLVETIIERAPTPLHAEIVATCDLSDVLRALVAQGLGIAWLPESTVDPILHSELVALDNAERWTLEIDIVAVRHRRNSTPALDAMWAQLQLSEFWSPPSQRLRAKCA